MADSFLFIDGVHPNRIAQSAFAGEIRAQVAAQVPLTESLPLLAVGLGLVCLLRRRG